MNVGKLRKTLCQNNHSAYNNDPKFPYRQVDKTANDCCVKLF